MGLHCHLFHSLLSICSWSAMAWNNSTYLFDVDPDPPSPPCPGCVPVYWTHLTGSRCFRIPSIIRTHQGTLLAFSENRPDGCADDSMHHHMLMVSRSTDGLHWEYPIIIKVGMPPCAGCPPAISNPNPVEVKRPDGSYAILLHFDTMNNPNPKQHGLDKQMWSYDDGMTWRDETTISFLPRTNVGQLIGPSTGIQGADGTIYFCNTQGFIYYSKDYGRSWNATAESGTGGECSIAFAEAGGRGSTIVDTRRTGKHRSIVFWKDLAPGPKLQPAALEGSDCQASIINVNGALYISSVGSAVSGGRAHMAIKRSTDGGMTWAVTDAVHDGPSGYGQLVDLSNSSMGLLFEAGKAEYTETISFVRLDLTKARHAEVLI